MLHINALRLYDIRTYSALPTEDELTMLSGSVVKVTGVVPIDLTGGRMVTMMEINPKHPLIDIDLRKFECFNARLDLISLCNSSFWLTKD